MPGPQAGPRGANAGERTSCCPYLREKPDSVTSACPGRSLPSPHADVSVSASARTHTHAHAHTRTHTRARAHTHTHTVRDQLRVGCGHWSLHIQLPGNVISPFCSSLSSSVRWESQSPWHRTALFMVDLTIIHDNPDLEAGSMSVLLCKAKAQEISMTCPRAQGVVAVGA